MASIGLNIARDGSTPLDVIRRFNVTWVRVVALDGLDLSGYFHTLRAAGIKILLVLARESGGDYAGYQRRYGSLVDAIEVGNEPDLTSPSSWTMTQVELAALGKAVRASFSRPFPLVVGGLASGHPEWLDGADLSWADAIAFHPYLRDAPNPNDLEDLPDVDALAAGYKRFGKPLLITEWGWWDDHEPRASDEVRDMVGWAGGTSDVEVFFYFCASDAMVPPFGLLDAAGHDKPRAPVFRDGATRAINSQWPAVQAQPVPAGPNPWQFFTADQVAAAAECPVDAVRANWPKLVEQIEHCGLTNRSLWLGLIGTVAIESASTFRPVREAFYLGEPEPAESYRKTLRYYPFYGRGFIQNTWRDSYAELGPKIAALWGAGADDPTFDLVANPDNLLDPDMSAAAAATFFRDKAGGALAAAAARGDWAEVRRLVYGGADPQGTARVARIASALTASAPPAPAPTPVDDRDEKIAAYELALRTLRDKTIPDLQAQVTELNRIVTQFIGAA